MFSSSNTFDPNTDIPALNGKVFVVTGGSAGIGFGICAHLLQHNCEALYILSKKEEHLSESEEKLKAYGDVAKVHSIQVDLADLHSVDATAKKLSSDLTRLDALILNAGIGVGPYAESRDGIETHMQVNVIAQHHLAMSLLPLLLKTPDSRLVLQSSDMHRTSPSSTTFKDLAEINQDIGPMKLYGRSKLAQILLVRALHERKQAGQLGLAPNVAPWINATHPGAVVTDQQEQAIDAYGTLGKIGVKATRPFMKEPIDEGCRPMLYAATSEDVVREKMDGQYIVPDCKSTEPNKQSQDDMLQEQLWKLVEEVLASKLGKLSYPTIYVK